jgi:hypothetical protein
VITNTFALAPAGVFGTGSADARPYACVAVRPSLKAPVAGLQGTRLPVAGMARRRGAELAGIGFPAALPTTTQQHDPISTNDGTTPLGIHSPGRPKS